MRDAMVSFLTLLFVCVVVWATISLIYVGVSFVSDMFIPEPLAWFIVGFVAAHVKPWKPVVSLAQDIWRYLDDRISR